MSTLIRWKSPRRAVFSAALLVLGQAAAQSSAASMLAQQNTPPSSSSSSSDSGGSVEQPAPRIAQSNAGGSSITLETSEPLFYIAASLNACGYDAGLADSSPVRLRIREEMDDQLTASAEARDARDALCAFIRQHALNDPGRSLAQYVSLALYLSPAPLLTPTVDIAELPPDSTQVVEVLPLVRTFAEAIHLNAFWAEHRPEYEAFVNRISDPLTKMVLNTNIYLHLPVSSYDGRRFLVLLEPMLSPAETNARIYSTDFIVVVSPSAASSLVSQTTMGVAAVNGATAPLVPMDLIRHTYLHFTVEPLVYAKAAAMDRLLPLLKPVQQAPLEFTYKSDIVALLTECLIKSIEAQTMDVGIPRPVRPTSRERSDQERYEGLLAVYDRQAEAVRRRRVELDMRQGWVLSEYFYNQLAAMEKEGISLKDNIGPMIYGMDVDRERHHDEQIAFLPAGSNTGSDVVRRAPHKLAGLDLAEMSLMKGDTDSAESMAEAALKTDPANAQAHYLLGRIDLMHSDPDGALEQLTQAIQSSHDPRTVAWSHIYLGRMYDIARDPDDPEAVKPQRAKALAEYRAALANRDSQPDTKAAAERGLKEPFTPPRRPAPSSDMQPEENSPLDPSGRAAKQAYRPPSQTTPQQ